MRYSTILADPPWNEKGGGKIKRGADKHYPLLKTEQIMALPIQEFLEPNAHLYLWVTNGHLPDGLRVLDAWGFKYKTNIAWAKDRMGIGQYYRGQHELCLFGVRGNIPYRTLPSGKRAQGRTLITAPRRAHSEKPEELRAMIQVVSPGPYLELFARAKMPGWDVWGDEVESDISMPGLWKATEKPKRQCIHSRLTKHEQGDTSDIDLGPYYTCDTCGETVEPDQCCGCKEKATRYAFCEGCYAEYREDPDAFK